MVRRLRRWYLKLRLSLGRWRKWPISHRLRIPEYTAAERRAMIRSLIDHPGWHYLMAELEDKRALQQALRLNLTSRINPATPAEPLVRQLSNIDEALFWIGWVQDKVRRANAMPFFDDYLPKKGDTDSAPQARATATSRR